jgi:PhzF family phenazine biosynthesis protein
MTSLPHSPVAQSPVECLVVDAFASEAFRGNPAGVCLLDNEVDDDWMRSVAAEMKHAETAFVLPRYDGSYDLRWWTPEAEVALCGHATLASAHALWETGRLAADHDAVFHTKSGELHATRFDDGRVVLDFPVAELEPADDVLGLSAAIGIAPVRVVRTPFFTLAELVDADAVRALAPDSDALCKVDTDAVLVTARAAADDTEHDVVSRVFGPRIGIPEDAVTGSAMCVLVPYWQDRLGPELRVAQLSARGGELGGQRDGDRVRISGRAVTVLRGELLA